MDRGERAPSARADSNAGAGSVVAASAWHRERDRGRGVRARDGAQKRAGGACGPRPAVQPRRDPPDVLVITCGVDVQVDRVEASVVGFTRASERLVLAHETFWGAPDQGRALQG